MKLANKTLVYYSILFLFFVSCAHKSYKDIPNREFLKIERNKKLNYDIFSNAKKIGKEKSGFYPLMNHIDSFGARIYLANIAKETIKVQYFHFSYDRVGKALIYSLLQAADRGVKVEILVDDINFTDETTWPVILESHPNIIVRSFNPTSYRKAGHYIEIGLYPGSMGRRMHNKSFIVDDSIAVFGGRNIAEEYFGLNRDLFWIDNDIMAAGNVVAQLSNQFKEYFSSGLSVQFKDLSSSQDGDIDSMEKSFQDEFTREKLKPLLEFAQERDFVNEARNKKLKLHIGKSRVFFDDPRKVATDVEDKEYHLNTQIEGKVDVKRSLHLISPYFIPSEGMMKRISELRKHNVEISVITNSLESTDGKSVYAYYSKHQKELLDIGVKLYEVHPNAVRDEFKLQSYNTTKVNPKVALHAKTAIIDGRYVVLGSANMDPRSRNLNTEIVAFIDNEDLAKREINYFNFIADKKNSYNLELDDDGDVIWKAHIDGKERVFTSHGDSSLWNRFQIYFLRVLPIRSLL